MVEQAKYTNPPITEAVIEFRFDKALSDSELKTIKKKLAPRYPSHTEALRKEITLDTQAEEISSTVEETRTKLSNEDGTRVVMLADKIMGISHLAPYESWDEIRNDAANLLELSKNCAGYRKITRYGVRYINRLDLKFDDSGSVEYEDYLNLRIKLPEVYDPLTGYKLSFASNDHDLKAKITVSSSAVEPIIIGHGAFYLDVDISSNFEIPQKAEALLELLDKVRIKKNNLFETFITDKARDLFDGG